MLRVVAALIARDGQLLIGQRPEDKTHPLEWEFPGGKIEAGESPRAALARELKEELGIRAEIGKEVTRYRYAYGSRTPLELIFFEVNRFSGEPVNRVFADIRWVRKDQLRDYSFLEGDRALIQSLTGN